LANVGWFKLRAIQNSKKSQKKFRAEKITLTLRQSKSQAIMYVILGSNYWQLQEKLKEKRKKSFKV
jgi:hypothetical protein